MPEPAGAAAHGTHQSHRMPCDVTHKRRRECEKLEKQAADMNAHELQHRMPNRAQETDRAAAQSSPAHSPRAEWQYLARARRSRSRQKHIGAPGWACASDRTAQSRKEKTEHVSGQPNGSSCESRSGAESTSRSQETEGPAWFRAVHRHRSRRDGGESSHPRHGEQSSSSTGRIR